FQAEDGIRDATVTGVQTCALPISTITTPDGVEVNDGTLAEVHESSQRVLLDQIRQGILADRLGFNYFFMTEHHFQPEGAEFSPKIGRASCRERRKWQDDEEEVSSE